MVQNNKQAAEAGDLEHFTRLYQGDNSRLMVTDARTRCAAHLAAAKNRVNILQFIYAQQGSEYFSPFVGKRKCRFSRTHSITIYSFSTDETQFTF